MKKYKIELKWGFYFILMGLIWMIMERAVGLHDKYIYNHPIYTNFVAIPAIAMYVLALLEKRKLAYNGHMTYLQSCVSGLVITAFITLITPISQLIISLVITPHYFTNAIQYTIEHQMMTAEKAYEYFSLKNYVISATIFAPIMGIITTLIVSIFTGKK